MSGESKAARESRIRASDSALVEGAFPFRIRRSRAGDIPRLIEIWRGAVEATHHFLAPADRPEIDRAACAYLYQAELWVLADGTDRPWAFSAVTRSNLDALFVAAEMRGRGLGRLLVRHALSLSSTLSTQVNEQNVAALGFYLKLGFTAVNREDCDDSGRPYPIIHLRKADLSPAPHTHADRGARIC